MTTNRLLPHQFGPGVTLDGTRIEASLRELVKLYNDVPADLVLRRWSCSPMIWGLSPPVVSPAVVQLPMMSLDNFTGSSNLQTPATDPLNRWRIKSIYQENFLSAAALPKGLLWETTFIPSRPVIIGGFTVMAELQTAAVPPAVNPYTNDWTWTGAAPPPHNNGDPLENFTLQVCLSDAWDLNDRRKLRQEALVYKTRSDAFLVQPDVGSLPLADTIVPNRPAGPFRGIMVEAKQPVLVPAGARVTLQWCILESSATNWTTFGSALRDGNAWTLTADVWDSTR